eukprot:CAMPEP_0114473720 /NCGR_PEP_ID=MMETSP0104-20121206/13139_1 /TAXON_ID=37642 ORGANISM="Paraphysomonas imperforata, Strain PA2" /NCGR_SAMPLE_ID=MMETSP0104 /ASSEMBLY_ACC=CAM_ASM_000202 /LENGTH=148 /DNA_ID=CAMNT_0001647937 /DNA_START=98 /DNA_END=544 /DNA_ORIENTATION=-
MPTHRRIPPRVNGISVPLPVLEVPLRVQRQQRREDEAQETAADASVACDDAQVRHEACPYQRRHRRQQPEHRHSPRHLIFVEPLLVPKATARRRQVVAQTNRHEGERRHHVNGGKRQAIVRHAVHQQLPEDTGRSRRHVPASRVGGPM